MKWLTRLTLCTIVSVAVLSLALIVGAFYGLQRASALQDEGWFFYVFNDLTNELIRINADGSQESFDLGLGDLQNPDENTFYLASGISAFSTDGRFVAYCVYQFSTTGATPTFFVVRDIDNATNIVNAELGTLWGCHVTPSAFGPDNASVAMGVVTSFPDDPNADPEAPIWYLRVYDLESGEAAFEMNANMAPFSEASTEFGALMPDVRHFDDQQIIFAQVPWGTGGAPEYSAFSWRYDEGEVTAFDLYGHSSVDILGQELIYVDYDPNLPAGIPSGPIGQFNALMLSENNGDARMIYHSPDWIIATARFINNGQQIAMRLLESTPEEIGSTRWIALSRDGSVVDLQPEYVGYDDMVAAPDGYIYIQASFDPDNTFTTVTHFIGSESSLLFETDEAALRLLWAKATPPAEELSAFPDFTP